MVFLDPDSFRLARAGAPHTMITAAISRNKERLSYFHRKGDSSGATGRAARPRRVVDLYRRYQKKKMPIRCTPCQYGGQVPRRRFWRPRALFGAGWGIWVSRDVVENSDTPPTQWGRALFKEQEWRGALIPLALLGGPGIRRPHG